MLSPPSELSAVSANVRRLLNLIQKEHARQGARHKARITLRLPIGTDWMDVVADDKHERDHVLFCVNEIIQHTGWQITGTVVKWPLGFDERLTRRALMTTMAYRPSRDESLAA